MLCISEICSIALSQSLGIVAYNCIYVVDRSLLKLDPLVDGISSVSKSLGSVNPPKIDCLGLIDRALYLWKIFKDGFWSAEIQGPNELNSGENVDCNRPSSLGYVFF